MPDFQVYIDALGQAAKQVQAGDVLQAYLAWQRYPSEAAFIAKQPTDKGNPGLRMLAENRLYRLLRESVTLLMKTGEELGIDPTSICESARVCERVCHDFLQWRDPCAGTDLWPGCLGSNVYRLSDHERQWVQQSDATLRRLVLAWQQRTALPPSAKGTKDTTKGPWNKGKQNPQTKKIEKLLTQGREVNEIQRQVPGTTNTAIRAIRCRAKKTGRLKRDKP